MGGPINHNCYYCKAPMNYNDCECPKCGQSQFAGPAVVAAANGMAKGMGCGVVAFFILIGAVALVIWLGGIVIGFAKPGYSAPYVVGVVASYKPDTGEVEYQHEEIPGHLEAGTHMFRLKNPQGNNKWIRNGEKVKCFILFPYGLFHSPSSDPVLLDGEACWPVGQLEEQQRQWKVEHGVQTP
jgi:hypothetical protein